MKNISEILKYLKFARKKFFVFYIFAFIMSFFQMLIAIYQANITRVVFNNIQLENIKGIIEYVPTATFIIFLAIAVNILMSYLGTKYSTIFTRDIQMHLISKLDKTKISYIHTVSSGEISTAANNGASVVIDFICNVLPNTFRTFLMIIGFSIYLAIVNWKLYIISIVLIPLFLFLAEYLKKDVKKMSCLENKLSGESNNILLDSIYGREIVKSFSMYESLTNSYTKKINEALSYKLKFEKKRSILQGMTYYIDLIPLIVCVCYGGYLTINNVITIGQLLVFVQLLRSLIGHVKSLPEILLNFNISIGGYQYYKDIIQNAPEEKSDGLFELDNRHPIPIDIDLSFSYNNNEEVLKSIKMKIYKNQKVAIVGYSGSGKSTLIKLLCGYYDTYQGTIKYYGKEISELDINLIRKNISVISQDVFMVKGTIKENISFGNQNCTMEDIVRSAKIANIHDYIIGLPNQYETEISELGSSLSGGQRQRLSIARAVLKNSPILIMDEPTSAMDAMTEKEIYQELNEYLSDKTALIISHRFSTIKNCDIVYVFENGIISEYGTHAELLAENGLYKKLFEKQIEEFVI